MSITIEWGGAVTTPNYNEYYCRVSERVFTEEELTGATVVFGGVEYTNVYVMSNDPQTTDGVGEGLWGTVNSSGSDPVFISGKAGLYQPPVALGAMGEFILPDDGTYFVRRYDTDGHYTESLYLPNAATDVPAMMLYNGMMLPSLPVWNKTTRPYAFMYKSTGFVNSVNLYICKTISYESTSNGYGLIAPAGSLNCYVGINGNAAISDSWSELSEKTTDSKMGSHAGICWANFDVLNEDGSVYLAATDPVPVGKPITDPLSFAMGYQIGCRLGAKRGRKPIGYLYNGVQLPEIPEVEGYALIYSVMGVSPISYRLLIMDFIPTHQDYIHVSITYDQAYGTGNYAIYGISNNEWVHTDDKTVTDGTFAKGRWKWSNVDLSDADGNVVLAASEPVPVYS